MRLKRLLRRHKTRRQRHKPGKRKEHSVLTAFLIPWLVLASVQLVATMSPGPAFVVTVKTALTDTRRAGILTALGLGIGLSIHLVLVMTGLSLFITKSPLLFAFIKYAGAFYLVYIGAKALLSKGASHSAFDDEIQQQVRHKTGYHAIRRGFFTNALNPKAMVFFMAVYTQFITPETPVSVLVLYGLTSILIETLWFSFVSVVLTHRSVKDIFVDLSVWIDRVCGALLIGLGARLMLMRSV